MTIQLSDKYPKIIQDLFLYDNNVGSSDAFKDLNFPFEYNISNLYKEASNFNWAGTEKTKSLEKIDRILLYKSKSEKNVMGIPLVQQEQNEKEDVCFNTDSYPEWDSFLKNIKSLGGVLLITMSKMYPDGYIYPHKDSNFVAHKIYFPLNWPHGCYFKIYKKGLVDFSDLKPKIINSGEHIHSVINDSKEERIIVSIFVDWNMEPWKKLFEERF
jgi:hypothetical protein